VLCGRLEKSVFAWPSLSIIKRIFYATLAITH
jgi:hypothetical protein